MSRLTELAEKIDNREARIGVIGLGYVGLPLAVEFAKAGFEVTGFDIDASKVDAIQAKTSYIEDVPEEDLAKAVDEGRLHASSDFAGLTRLDVINICVPTPLTRTKDPDVSHMASAVEEIRRRLRSGQLVILASTTPNDAGGHPAGCALAMTDEHPSRGVCPDSIGDYSQNVLGQEIKHDLQIPFTPTVGEYYHLIVQRTGGHDTTNELFVPMLEESGLEVGEDFSLAFAPERIDPANKVFTVRNVPKVVGGQTPLCTELASKIFGTIFDEIVPVSSTQSAEMVKLLENTFRAINIGLANEVALMCERLGLDVWEVIEAAATKPYGFMKFLPGPGLGGHCIPVDPSYLSWKMKSLNFPARFIDLATDINSRMPEHVCERVADLLNQDRKAVNGAKILVLGVAYKSNVGDMRESPALDVIRILAEKGAGVSYSDPHVPSIEVDGVKYEDVGAEASTLAEADLCVILTDHQAYDYKGIVENAKRVFDTRNAARDVTEHREKITKL